MKESLEKRKVNAGSQKKSADKSHCGVLRMQTSSSEKKCGGRGTEGSQKTKKAKKADTSQIGETLTVKQLLHSTRYVTTQQGQQRLARCCQHKTRSP